MMLVRWGETARAKAFAKKLREKDTVDVVGFSTGGPAALDLARNLGRPVGKL